MGGKDDGVEIKIDGNRRTYYVDNTGRVYHLMDTQLLFEGIVATGKSFTSWASVGWDVIRGEFNFPTALGTIGLTSMELVYNERVHKYFLQDGYVRAAHQMKKILLMKSIRLILEKNFLFYRLKVLF